MNVVIVSLSSLLAGIFIGLIFAVRSYPRREVLSLIREFIKVEKKNFGEWKHFRETVDHTVKVIVKPNCETLYSSTFIDLGTSDYTLEIPETSEYFSVCFLNTNTETLRYITNNDLNPEATTTFRITSVFPERLENQQTIHFEDSLCWIIVRFGIPGNGNKDVIIDLQNRLKLTPC